MRSLLPSSTLGRFAILAAPPCLLVGAAAGIGLHLGWLAGLGLGGLLLLWHLAALWHGILAPLRRLLAALAREPEARLPIERPREVGEVAAAVNQLSARLTDQAAAAIEADREVDRMRAELAAQPEIRRQKQLVEEANHRLAARLRELSLLFDITRSLNSTLELDELLGRLTEMVATTLGFDGFAVLLVDSEQRQLHLRAAHGVLPRGQHVGDRIAVEESGACGEAWTNGELVLQRCAPVGSRNGSVLAVPMEHKGQVVGVLQFTRQIVDGFTNDEIKLVGSIAGQAALAIANARLYEQTLALTITDPLTGVYNRRHLFRHLEMELRRAERYLDPVTVAMLDIDHFKQLNDHWGHAAGDTVLQQVARVLTRHVRRVDTVARFGGEEFCIVLPRLAREDSLEVAEKLRLAIEAMELQVGPRRIGNLTISVGVATYPRDGTEAVGLINAADAALYASKRGGRNRSTVYQPGMELHPDRRRQITAADSEVPCAVPSRMLG